MALKPPLVRSAYVCSRCLQKSRRQRYSTAPPSSSKSAPALPIDRLNSYASTSPPNTAQLKYARTFFTMQEPRFLFSASHFRSFPADSTAPEICMLGRSNAGKSSLLNALLGPYRGRAGRKLAFVSARPGRTRVMNVFGVGGAVDGGAGVSTKLKPGLSAALLRSDDAKSEHFTTRNLIGRGGGGLCVVDCPGYGFASKEEWGKEIEKYLAGRRQLRRAFVLVDARRGIGSVDEMVLDVLRRAGTPHQLVLSKVDYVLSVSQSRPPSEEKMERLLAKLEILQKETRDKSRAPNGRGAEALDDVLCCSAEKVYDSHEKIGIDALRWAVLQAVGLQCDENGRKLSVNINIVSPERDITHWSPHPALHTTPDSINS